jgi:uncharacterized protein (TIGR03435 family)
MSRRRWLGVDWAAVQTGLAGRYDFAVEWVPEGVADEGVGATFLEAVREQMGMKPEGDRAQVRILVVDGVGRASEN